MGSVPDSFVEEILSVIPKQGICIAGKRSVPPSGEHSLQKVCALYIFSVRGSWRGLSGIEISFRRHGTVFIIVVKKHAGKKYLGSFSFSLQGVSACVLWAWCMPHTVVETQKKLT